MRANADIRNRRCRLARQDAVVVALGGRDATSAPPNGLGIIAATARTAGTRRLIASSSAGPSTDHMPFYQRQVTRLATTRIKRRIPRRPDPNGSSMADRGLDWTLVRVPIPTDRESTSTYRPSIGGHLGQAATVARATSRTGRYGTRQDPQSPTAGRDCRIKPEHRPMRKTPDAHDASGGHNIKSLSLAENWAPISHISQCREVTTYALDRLAYTIRRLVLPESDPADVS
ncbi:NAD(P)H-binding protein [Nocardia sp. NPDC051463]|uniref:NAD(P)H-binding protein n=1 Tax=Nocardia sp. NPDC051463 TaxID=3154845 RepID=UPI00343BCDEC